MSCVLGKQSTAALLTYFLHCFLHSTIHAYTDIQSHASFFTLQLTENQLGQKILEEKHFSAQ